VTKRSVLTWALLAFAGSCSTSRPLETPPPSEAFDLVSMGTVWNFRIAQSEFNETTWWPLKEESQKILEKYDQTFSSWRKDSEVSKLGPLKNISDPKSVNRVSELMREGLDFAAEAFTRTDGAFDIRTPRGLDFGGITKGHVLGELAWLFLKSHIENFAIDGGGGNQVLAGAFRQQGPESEKPENSEEDRVIQFRAASRAQQGDKQHIFDRTDPGRKIDGSVVIYCTMKLNKNYLNTSTHEAFRQTKLVGALSDAFTKALLIRGKRWALPNFCQELTSTRIKFL
jgi:thiamine biosynthesis lipoprotein ApbE